jgi:hypothetical protein
MSMRRARILRTHWGATMSKKSIKRVRASGTGQKGESVVQFFDWEKADPTKYAGVNGLTEELITSTVSLHP